jgi:hypothetical protein
MKTNDLSHEFDVMLVLANEIRKYIRLQKNKTKVLHRLNIILSLWKLKVTFLSPGL